MTSVISGRFEQRSHRSLANDLASWWLDRAKRRRGLSRNLIVPPQLFDKILYKWYLIFSLGSSNLPKKGETKPMKRMAILSILILTILSTPACAPTNAQQSKPKAEQSKPCVVETSTGGAEKIRIFSATATGTKESVAMATNQINQDLNFWLKCNPTIRIIDTEHKDTSTGRLPDDGFAYNTVFVTITVLVHYTSP